MNRSPQTTVRAYGQNGVSASDIAEAVLEFYIEGEDDLIGLLAYALYERQKRDFVLSHRKRNA